MSKIVEFTKKNWLSLVLILVVAYLLARNTVGTSFSTASVNYGSVGGGFGAVPMMAKVSDTSSIGFRESTPTSADQRLLLQDTTVDELVKDVTKASQQIEDIAKKSGGYLVNKGLSKPEGGEFGHIEIRVPTEKREAAIEEIKAVGIKTIGYEVFAQDLTDSYTDLETQLANLEKVKTKMDAILDQATKVTDLVDIQMQINNIQQQIDSIKGQQNYLTQVAKLTKIHVNLSTDEMALPYVPDTSWRPATVFKSAVRSMVITLRYMFNVLVWVIVYIPVFLILGLVFLIVRLVWKKIKPKSVNQ